MGLRKTPLLIKIALFYLVTWCISPPLAYGNVFRVIAIAAVLYIVVRHLLKSNFSIAWSSVVLFFIMAYILAVSWFSGESFTLNMAVLIVVAFVFCMNSCSVFREDSFFLTLMVYTLALCVLWNITTSIGLTITPNAMRLLAKNSDISRTLSLQGVGGFGYEYVVLLMMPIAFDLIFTRKTHPAQRVIAVLYVISAYYMTLRSQYFLAIVLSALVILLFLMFKIKNKWVKLFLILALLAGFVFVFYNAENIIDTLRGVNTARSVDTKLSEINDILIDGETSGNSDLANRIHRYGKSLTSALAHPLFGSLSRETTGNHSFFLDLCGFLGFPVAGLLLYSLIKPLQRFNVFKSSVGKICMLMLGIMLMLNEIVFVYGMAAYLLIPFYCWQKYGGEAQAHE